jgi:hypothetical protein
MATQLHYFGVRHTYDPADSQFVAMQDLTDVPDSWFDPVPSEEGTGKGLFNNVNSAGSFFRDVYMYRLLAAGTATPGARVFAEVGRDHIPAQAAALRCLMPGG